MIRTSRTPTELRSMFGDNLRQLSKTYPSISELARQLGINRTQFNRYLSGESFPRPDVLDRICTFFGVDARILLEPVNDIADEGQILTGPVLADFAGAGARDLTEEQFPSGFYRFARRSFVTTSHFVVGLVYVFRRNGYAFVRGYEAKEAMRQQNLPSTAALREFRGYVSRQDDGIALSISGRNGTTCSFNFLSRAAAMQDKFWVGYLARTVRESVTETRVTRMVYEHLDQGPSEVLAAARNTGFIESDELMPFHRRLLQPDVPFN